jgi:beta-galactosidase/beta-glucuronidase
VNGPHAFAVHPRPQLQRESLQWLDGDWELGYDDSARFAEPGEVPFDRRIVVPFPPESTRSQIGEHAFHPVIWYRRQVATPPAASGEELLLHFGAVDYSARVFIDGALVGEHAGGHTPFHCRVPNAAAQRGHFSLVVRVVDDPHDLAQPRGKQDWQETPHEIWYPRTTGIWQSVWLERVGAVRIDRLTWTPHLDRWEVGLDTLIAGDASGLELRVVLAHRGELLCDDRYALTGTELARRIAFADPGIDDRRNRLLWTPDHPTLFDASLELRRDGEVIDRVWSYTALRSVGTSGNRFLLNGRPYFLRMVLDQGYWPDTLLAPPSGDALRADVELTRRLGFNAARKHQKIEDPRWLAWCDRLGLLVWAEMPSPYRFTPRAVERLVGEWIEVVRRDVSHPSVVAWVPLNESWGVPDLTTNPAHRDYVRALYHLTKTLDPARPVVGNDGWEHLATDLVTIHDYAADPAVLAERYATPESVAEVLARQQPGGRALLIGGFAREERPVVISEFGGIAISDGSQGWGYSRVRDAEALTAGYEKLLAAVHDARGIAGFCYTQLTDTFQEQNGLATMARVVKGDTGRLARATRGQRSRHPEET